MKNKVARRRDHTEAAADTLAALAALASPGEQGKPGLPEPEPEPEYLDYSEEDTDGEDEEKDDIIFTEQDRKDLPVLEQRVESAGRQQAEALREIRQRQLWRLIQDDQGRQLYPSFEDYCQDRLGHPRQWVTHHTNWLRIEEEKERLGIKERLTVKAAQGLLIGRLKEAGGLRAVLEEAKEDGVPLDRDHLREIVIRRADFNYRFKDGTEGINKPAAKTYADHKKDLATVKELGEGQTSWDVVKRAKALEGDLGDNLVSLCQQERVLPKTDTLLAVLTGEALKDVVGRLKDVGKEQTEIKEKKERLKTLNKQLKEGQKKEREERKALEQELMARGVLKPKAKPSQPAPQNGSPAPQPETPDDDEQEPSQAPESVVYRSIADAYDYLDEALTCDWPDEESELNAILLKAQECETKLAEITTKAKELLADAEEPEGVPSGDNQ